MIRCRESAERRGIVVLGIGNVLLTDEGAGVHAVRRLAREIARSPGVECIDGGTLGIPLASEIEGCDALIVIDAAEIGLVSGSVAVFEGNRMDFFLGATGGRSAHETGLLDLMAVAALAGELPERRALIGIQAACLDWGACASIPVQAGIETACECARELIERWR